MSSLPSPYLTPEEYLALDRQAEQKSEYYAGEMFAMSGGTVSHAQISANLIAQFDRHLGDGPCRAMGSDLRVLVDTTGLYTYPDVVVVCGEPELLDQHQDTLTNPRVIVEVLSPSSEPYDRGKKWEHYQQLPSLCEYLLISQDRPRVELYSRNTGTEDWCYSSTRGLDAAVTLPSLGCSLSLETIYRHIRFAPEPAAPQDSDPA